MAEARTGNNGGSGRSTAWLDVRGNLCLLLSPASSAELPVQQGSWKWSLACHQVRWGSRVWGCHFPYLLPDECADLSQLCICHPAMGRLIHWGWVSPKEHPESAHSPVAFDEMCVVLLHGVAVSWHHVGAGGPVRGSAAGERADRIRGARSVQSQLLAGV